MPFLAQVKYWLAAVAILYLSTPAYAALPGSDQDVPTFFFSLGLGLTTYKSKALLSNDTSLSTGYLLGTFAGVEKTVAITLKRDMNVTAFEHQDSSEKSSVDTSFERTTIGYRWGYIAVGAAFSQTTITISNKAEDYVDAIGTGVGGHVNMFMPLGKNNSLFMDAAQTSPLALRETVQSRLDVIATLGSQTEVIVGGKIKLTKKLLDLQIGYKYRAFELVVAGETFQELQTMTWIALELSKDF